MKGLDGDFLNNKEAFINDMMMKNKEQLIENSRDIKNMTHLTAMDVLAQNAKIIDAGLKESAALTFGVNNDRSGDMKELEEMNKKLKDMINKNNL